MRITKLGEEILRQKAEPVKPEEINDDLRNFLNEMFEAMIAADGVGLAGPQAAAMLFGMNRLFSLGLTKRQLMERGVQIGADVPYCIMRGTALAEGIGEELSPLPPMVKCPVLIAKPSISVSTRFVYQNLKLDDTTIHPDIDLLIEDIKAERAERKKMNK